MARECLPHASPENQAKWRQFLPQSIVARQPRRPGVFIDLRSPGEPSSGGWARYRVRPVSLEGMPEPSAEMVHFLVDSAADGTAGRGSITILWDLTGTPADRDHRKWKKPEDDVRQYVVTRLSLDDGKMTEVERFEMIELPARAEFAAGPGVMFFNPRENGLAVVRQGEVRHMREADGLPFKEVVCMAWLEDKLYLGAPGALARLDPRTMSYELLASSRAVAPRNDLDGGNLWHVNSMLPDPERHCLWISTDTDIFNATQIAQAKYGIWKFSPADGSLRKMDPGAHGYLTWSDGRIFFMARVNTRSGEGRGAFGLFDPRTEEVEELKLEQAASYNIWNRPRDAFFNGDLINTRRQLYRPDGQFHVLQPDTPRWDYIVRCGPGLLACTLAENKMWYIDVCPPGDENGAKDATPGGPPIVFDPATARTWHMTGTPPFEASLVRVTGGMFILKRRDGGNVVGPIERLSKEDQDYIRQRVTRKR